MQIYVGQSFLCLVFCNCLFSFLSSQEIKRFSTDKRSSWQSGEVILHPVYPAPGCSWGNLYLSGSSSRWSLQESVMKSNSQPTLHKNTIVTTKTRHFLLYRSPSQKPSVSMPGTKKHFGGPNFHESSSAFDNLATLKQVPTWPMDVARGAAAEELMLPWIML